MPRRKKSVLTSPDDLFAALTALPRDDLLSLLHRLTTDPASPARGQFVARAAVLDLVQRAQEVERRWATFMMEAWERLHDMTAKWHDEDSRRDCRRILDLLNNLTRRDEAAADDVKRLREQDLTNLEIAEALGMSENAVKQTVHRFGLPNRPPGRRRRKQ